MLLIPISQESNTARRWPWVTTGLILACLVMLVITEVQGPEHERRLGYVARERQAYHVQHPWLMGPADPDEPARPRADVPAEELPPATVQAEQQAVLDGYIAAYRAELAATPFRRWGWRASGPMAGIITHQFVHAGFMHFGFNMWFLWLCGCSLEDRWGRLVFVGLYLMAGVAAALLYSIFATVASVPLVGASGAIAGAMGAFLVSFARTKIRFFYAIWLGFRPLFGTFRAAAYTMLPLWLAVEVFEAFVENGDGVAHWAHVGGFLFGLPFALALRLTGIERWLDNKLEAHVTTMQDPRLLEAGRLIDVRDYGPALSLLEDLERENPDSLDVMLEQLRAASNSLESEREVRSAMRLMTLYLEQDMAATAADLLLELTGRRVVGGFPAVASLRLAELFARRGMKDQALQLFRQTHAQGLVDVTAVKGAIAEATLLLRQGQSVAAVPILDAAAASTYCSPELQERIEMQRRLLENRRNSEGSLRPR